MGVGGTLQVATYNVHRCIGRGGRRDVDRVVRVLQRLEATIIALQEVETLVGRGAEHDQFVFLGGSLSMRSIPGPTMLRRDATYGNVLLTSHRVVQVRYHDLGVPRREIRGALDVDLDVNGRPLRVVTTHLGLGGRERDAQIARLLEIVRGDPGPLLVLGDFNEWRRRSRRLRRLEAIGPAWAPPSFPARFPLVALDRIIAGPGLRLERLQALRSGEAARASDHLPLCARLSFCP